MYVIIVKDVQLMQR